MSIIVVWWGLGFEGQLPDEDSRHPTDEEAEQSIEELTKLSCDDQFTSDVAYRILPTGECHLIRNKYGSSNFVVPSKRFDELLEHVREEDGRVVCIGNHEQLNNEEKMNRILMIYNSAKMDIFESETFWIDEAISDAEARIIAKQLPEYKQHEEAACMIIDTPKVDMDGDMCASGNQIIAMFKDEFANARMGVTFWNVGPAKTKYDFQALRRVELPEHPTFRAIHNASFIVVNSPTKTLAAVPDESGVRKRRFLHTTIPQEVVDLYMNNMTKKTIFWAWCQYLNIDPVKLGSKIYPEGNHHRYDRLLFEEMTKLELAPMVLLIEMAQLMGVEPALLIQDDCSFEDDDGNPTALEQIQKDKNTD